jgi:isopenicillin-N N-acyltransferase-like protein
MDDRRIAHVPLYCVEVRGDSRARGVQHGRLLKHPIAAALDFYRAHFKRFLDLDPAEIRRRAARFIAPTAQLSARLMAEYEGIAEGAGQALEDILALSGRYEITYDRLRLGECSNVFAGSRRTHEGRPLLGMNWDWRPETLDFRAVITARCDDGPDHIVVTECGQPGKYGVNAHGLAVVSSGLVSEGKCGDGRQLFVAVIREMLAQRTLVDAHAVLHRSPPEATISFFVADDTGHGFNTEATKRGLVERRFDPDTVAWHTNHCLLTDEPCSFDDSRIRAERWRTLTSAPQPVTRAAFAGWLADTANGVNAICKAADPAARHLVTWLQTICSIVIDPVERRLWVSDGLSSEQPLQEFHLA